MIPSEVEYAEVYSVPLPYMAWRRRVIEEFSEDGFDGALRFAQEYPVSADEAFLGSSGNSFLAPATVEAARLRPTICVGPDAALPLVMGLDPAPQHGSAASALVWRKGRICYRVERIRGLAPIPLAMKVYQEFQESGGARLCVDESEGVGHTVVSHLQNLAGTAGKVVGVRFGNPAHDRSIYQNMRAQIWSRLDKWLRNGGAIPDETPEPGQASLASELLSVRLKPQNEKRIAVEAKAEVIKRLGASPDAADALACTFIYPDPAPHFGGTVIAGTEYSDPERMVATRPRRLRYAENDGYHVAHSDYGLN